MNIKNLTVEQIRRLVKNKTEGKIGKEELELLNEMKRDSRKGVKKLALWYDNRIQEIKRENRRLRLLTRYENSLWNQGYRYIAGIDEAGRGPLAGPVVAAAVILPRGVKIRGLDDSKKLTSDKREELFQIIHQQALSVNYAIVDNDYIDEHNIYNATLHAMKKAVEGLSIKPEYLLVDGVKLKSRIPHKSIVGGDSRSASIAAASIIAKVVRDRIMLDLHNRYPQYRFDKHKGYPTREHIELVKLHGLSPVHRKSFKIR